MSTKAYITESWRMLARSKKKFNTFSGNHEQICRKIIESCFNGRFFQVSIGHFTAFYTRDFGMCVQSLINLGYQEQCVKTLQFALNIYATNNTLTTTITKTGEPVNFFDYGIDTLPFLLRALRVINDKNLMEKYRPFLEMQSIKYRHRVWDEKNKRVRTDKTFSSIKDHYARKSSCYDNCMVAMASKELQLLGFDNPLADIPFKKEIIQQFWQNNHFADDSDKDSIISSDAQVFPFYCGIITDKNMLNKVIETIQKEKLDQPFPLKYTSHKNRKKLLKLPAMLAPNYEGNTIWAHLGLCYIETIQKTHPKLAQTYIEQYKSLIEKHKTFLELYHPDGSPYRTLLYQADEGMLWAAIYLDLQHQLVQKK